MRFADGNWRLRVTSTNRIQTRYAAVDASSSVLQHGASGLGVVRPYLYGRHVPTSFVGTYTNINQMIGTYSNVASGATALTFGGVGGTGCGARFLRIAFWKGTDAETILAKNTLSRLGWALGY
jgi:hypothetical protein